MDFLEKLFGIAPDGGTGTLEVALLLVPVLIVLALGIQRRRLARHRD